MTTSDRFWAKVEKSDDGCWLWTGAKRHKGYGAFVYARNGEAVQGRAHRYSYEIHVGPIPCGMFVLHRCDTPACVRPDHLFLGSNQDNVTDMMQKGRHVAGGTYCGTDGGNYEKGELHHNAVLSEDVVRLMRRESAEGASCAAIARRHGIARLTAWKAITRKTWRHVD